MPGKIAQVVEDVSGVRAAKDVRNMDFSLIINPDESGQATGKVMMAESDSEDEIDKGKFESYEINL